MSEKYAHSLLTTSHAMLTFLLALTIAWALLASVNFFYGFWHDKGGIGQGIEQYGPQNRFKKGFENTTREERIRLFSQINAAVHLDASSLADIRYHVNGQKKPQMMLRKPEIIHLEDVYHLINTLKRITLGILLAWCLIGFMIYKKGLTFPSMIAQTGKVLLLITVSSGIIYLIGAEAVFNQLHIWIFPPGNQWYFTYQESLMTTLMMAPKLFLFIAIEIVLLSIPIFITAHLLMGKLFTMRKNQPD